MRRIALALAFFLLPNLAWSACSSTIQVKDGAGSTQTFCVGTDGSGNFFSKQIIVDATAGANGLAVNSSGQIAVSNIGCAGQTVANTNVTPINNAGSASNLKLVSKVSAQQIYICAIDIVAAAATNVALVEGTQTTNQCDTSTAGMAGGATAATGWNFGANGGLSKGNGTGIVFRTATVNHDVCLLFSAGNQVSGSITWAQF